MLIDRNGDLNAMTSKTYEATGRLSDFDDVKMRVEAGETVFLALVGESCLTCKRFEPSFAAYAIEAGISYSYFLNPSGDLAVAEAFLSDCLALWHYFDELEDYEIVTPMLMGLSQDGAMIFDIFSGSDPATYWGDSKTKSYFDQYFSLSEVSYFQDPENAFSYYEEISGEKTLFAIREDDSEGLSLLYKDYYASYKNDEGKTAILIFPEEKTTEVLQWLSLSSYAPTIVHDGQVSSLA